MLPKFGENVARVSNSLDPEKRGFARRLVQIQAVWKWHVECDLRPRVKLFAFGEVCKYKCLMFVFFRMNGNMGSKRLTVFTVHFI